MMNNARSKIMAGHGDAQRHSYDETHDRISEKVDIDGGPSWFKRGEAPWW
jgi:hypothetical protein